MSLALATVVYEWRRYMAAVIALAFSGLLVLAQVGMFVGIGKAFTATIDRSRADIFVLNPKSESLQGQSGVPRRIMPLVYMNPEVVAVSDMDGDGAAFANIPPPGSKEKRKREYVSITAVDTEPNALTLPTDFTEAQREALEEPYAVAIDRSALSRLGVKLGDKAVLGGRAVRVRVVLTTYPNLLNPTVVLSRQTLRLLNMAYNGTRVGPLMVKLRDPAKAKLVRDELNAKADGRYRAWTRPELAAVNEQLLMKNNFIGVLLGFSSFMGLLIGIGITSQTLRGAVLANIKEFASLRALGVSMGALRLIVIELSFWVGMAGLVMTAVFVTIMAGLAKLGGLPMGFPAANVTSTAIFLLVISIVSGLMSLGVLSKSQPADLLR